MIDVDTFYKIKHLYHDGHFRVGQIAEQLHLDVETVSKWIQRDTYRRRTGQDAAANWMLTKRLL